MRPSYELNLQELQAVTVKADHDLRVIDRACNTHIQKQLRDAEYAGVSQADLRDEFNNKFVTLVTDLKGTN